jgi:hypothetical protein
VGSPKSPAASQQTKPQVQIGRLLVDAGLITERQLADALLKQVEWGSRLGDTLMGLGWIKPKDFYLLLARRLDLDFVDLLQEPADASLFESCEYANYVQHQFLPWRRKDGILWIATADPMSPGLIARWNGRAMCASW